jgi:LPS-assembly protein
MRQGALRDFAPLGRASGRGWVGKTIRASLLAGAAVLGVHSQALAQAPQGNIRNRAPAPPLPDDGLGPRDLLLQADTVMQDQPNSTVTATGHVQARYQGRTLRTDKLIYNTVTGVTHAIGHAVVVNPDGSTVYGDDITLDDQFRAAVALGFATRQTGNTTLTAGAAFRRNDVVNQLNSAVYTSCNICALDGSPKPPTWSISATRIIQDRQHQVIYYKNAVIRVLGVPVFYSPVFWHPDPTSPRRSGLLTPKIEYSRRRGFSYQQPYLIALNPSTDLIVSPQINTRVNPFLNVRYTERFYSGLIDIRAGYTYSEEFNNHQFFDNDTSRSYILARGLFDVTPDQNWVWGFGAERTTDPTLFARYGIHDVYTDRGPFPADTDRLISQLYTVRSDSDSYVSISALDFQSIRAYGTATTTLPNGTVETLPQGIYESSRSFPAVAPLIEARYDAPNEFLGGQLRFQASAVALNRNDQVLSIFDPTGGIVQGPQESSNFPLQTLANLPQASQLSGLLFKDSRRVSVGGDWRSSFTLDNGMRFEPFVYGRGDEYSLTEPELLRGFSATQNVSGAGAAYTGPFGGILETPGKSDVGRVDATAGVNFSWPFIKSMGEASVVLEPLAQLAISPNYRLNPNIPNEDSASFEFDETNLFSIDRFSGYDLVEGGQRLNVGARATANWGPSQSASLLVGRTFRAEPDPQFTQFSGLEQDASDWVVATSLQPIEGFSIFSRTRLDKDDYEVRREEAGVGYSSQRFNVNINYDLNENGIEQLEQGQQGLGQLVGQSVITRTEDVSVSGNTFLTAHWGVGANVSRDLSNEKWPLAQFDLIYQDECIRVDLLYTHEDTYSDLIGASNSITFRIGLSTLGGTAPLTPTNSRGSR